jgi:hypothetical protein
VSARFTLTQLEGFMRKLIVLVIGLLALPLARAQDATALEEQYKTCARHSIPSDKCTPEIYEQLKAKDNAPLDPNTAAALSAVKEYRSRLKNPSSMQVQTAYVTSEGAVCLAIGGQNGMGGISVSRVVYIPPDFTGAKRLRGHWFDETGFGGANSANIQSMNGSGYSVDRWPRVCYKAKFSGGEGPMLPGTDVTEKVNQALQRDAAKN